jgi:hypothetical protein
VSECITKALDPLTLSSFNLYTFCVSKMTCYILDVMLFIDIVPHLAPQRPGLLKVHYTPERQKGISI